MTAKQRAARILAITRQTRKDFLKFTIAQERAMLEVYRHSSLKIMNNILRHSEMGLIPPAAWGRLLKDVSKEMRMLGDDVTGIVHNGWVESARYGIQGQIDALHPIIPAGFQTELAVDFLGINKSALEMLTRRSIDGLLLSERIWDLTHSTLMRLKRDIGVAVVTGKSVDKLTREIRTYMTYTGAKGRGIYRSEYKNARRITRTECNRAYREGQIRYAEKKKFIVGLQWHTVAGCCSKCAPLDGTVYKKDEVPDLVHPHCMCYLTSVLDEKLYKPEERMPTPLENDLSTGAFKSIDDLGGGINETFIIKTKKGSKGIFKPVDGERRGVRGNIPTGTFYKREVAAYKLDKELGWDMVPTTVYRTHHDTIGSMQQFVSRAKFTFDVNVVNVTKYEQNLRKLSLFDVIIGNTDRHGQNYLIKKTGEVYAIDNGLAFPGTTNVLNFKSRPFEKLFNIDAKIPDSLLKDLRKLQKRKGEIYEILKSELSKKELDGMFIRIARILRIKKYLDTLFTGAY